MSASDTRPPVTGWRRWSAYLALTVVFAVACGLLSWWQWARRAETAAENLRVAQNYDADPRAIDDVLPALDAWDEGDEWTRVELHGTYLTDEALLVRNRVLGGQPGFEQLVPLQLEDGTVVVIDRGWLPVGNGVDALPDVVPQPPAGQVDVIARLRGAEPELPGRTAPAGQISSIDVATIVDDLGVDGYTGAYGVVASEDPAVAEMPAAAPRPEEDEGMHLSYALQWIAFGVLAFIGLFWAWRRERRIAALPVEEQAAARAPKRRHDDADVEDAILDRLDA
ncbi:SURF1 family cytochrome oxidase biogenesis protein [Protaetiibacter mangrovi]|uniref:SURF1-like protein n=1 Tax=Protaetiibacter mangrovi TaxID=2970926 RepID=A0ABT1ZC44_9MICO|nr:SURF1 family cytochrome oxidase biogenesis protein [Protaetiibacter mangrovi]MCS0498269.1 SURF1 family protein [Protaetiibacter mangrovi]